MVRKFALLQDSELKAATVWRDRDDDENLSLQSCRNNIKDPTGVDKLERGAMREFAKRMKLITKGYIDILNRIPAEPVMKRALHLPS